MKPGPRISWIVALLVSVAWTASAVATPDLDAASEPFVAISPNASKFDPAQADLQNATRAGSVELNFEALRELAASEAGSRQDVVVEPFDGTVVTLDGNSLFINQSATIVGRLKDGESGVFILSWAGTNLYGMLEAGLTRYLFETQRDDPWGTLRVKEVDQASFPRCGEPPSSEPRGEWAQKGSSGSKSQPANHTVIEMMILYTADMAGNHSGDPAALANTLEASVTAAMSASSVTGSAKIVAYKPTTFSEASPFATNDFISAREDMKAESAPFTAIESDQDDLRADVVVLLVDGDDVGDDPPFNFAACGLADTVSSSDNERAYAVVQDRCAAGDLTFVHEVTHLLGGRHDWGNTGGTDDTAGWTPGTGHGYTSTTPDFRTVMGSKTGCTFAGGCSRLSRYSDPDQTALISGTNYALGLADDWPDQGGNQRSDVVDVLANSITDVALYRQTGDAAPGQPSSLTVDRLCGGYNELTWPAPTGTTGWYEAQSASNSGYTTSVFDEYRGGENSFILNVSSTRYVRVRACNAEGCGSYRNGGQTATTGCP